MVRRFGAGNIEQVREGRVFRGAPREQPREEVIISESTSQQRQEISNELNSVINERNRIEAELERLNPADGSRIGSISVIKQLQSQSQGLTERINFLIGLRDNLQEGQIVEDLQGAFREGEQLGERKARQVLIRKESISQKVRTAPVRSESEVRRRLTPELREKLDSGQALTEEESLIVSQIRSPQTKTITVSEQFLTGNIISKEDIQRQRVAVREGENIARANFGDVASLFRLQSRKENVRPITTRQFFSDIRTGTGKASTALIEGTINLATSFGVRKIGSQEQKFNLSNVKALGIGRRAEEFKLAPIRTGTIIGAGALLSVPLIIGGGSFVGSVKAVGLKQASASTILSFTPFRLAPGTFGTIEGTKAAKTVFKVKGQAVKVEGGIFRSFRGQALSDPNVKIVSQQIINTKGAGFSRTTIKAPTTTITGSGKIIEGTRTIVSSDLIKGITGPVKLGTTSKIGTVASITGKQGFAAQTKNLLTFQQLVTQDKVFLSATTTGKSFSGGLSQRLGDTTRFVSGTGTKEFKFSPSTGLQQSVKVQKISVIGTEKTFQDPFTVTKITSTSGSFKPSTTQETLTTSAQLLTAGTKAVTTPKITPPVTKGAGPVVLSPQKIRLEQEVRSTQDVRQLLTPRETTIQTTTQTNINLEDTTTISTPTTTTSFNQQPTQETGFIQSPIQNITPRIKQPIKQTPTTSKPPFAPPRIPRTPREPNPPRGISIEIPFRRPEKVKKAKSFEVFGRRRGVFRPIGRAVTQRQAFSIGRTFATTTLGATFKVTGPKTLGTPRGFRRKETTQGTLFIERRSLRLDTPTEIKSIQRARRKKKKKRNK